MKQSIRFTASRLDAAILEEIRHQRISNVPVNAISSAATFTLMVAQRLFGKGRQIDPALQECVRDLIADTRRVRAEAEIMERAEREKQRAAAPRVILTGQNN